MGRPIVSVNDVSIETVEVSIDTVRVNNKSMTIAVFEQLPVASVLGDDGDLRGPAWGRVRRGDAEYVLWVSGTELRRSFLPDVSDERLKWLRKILRSEAVAWRVRLDCAPVACGGGTAEHLARVFLATATFKSYVHRFSADEIDRLNGAAERHQPGSSCDAARVVVRDRLVLLLGEYESDETHVLAMRQRARVRLEALPQLFIAA